MHLVSHFFAALTVCSTTLLSYLSADASVANRTRIPRFKSPGPLFTYGTDEDSSDNTVWLLNATDTPSVDTLTARDGTPKPNYVAHWVQALGGWKIAALPNLSQQGQTATSIWVGFVRLGDKELGQGSYGRVYTGESLLYDPYFVSTIDMEPKGQVSAQAAIKPSEGLQGVVGAQIVEDLQNNQMAETGSRSPYVVDILRYAMIPQQMESKNSLAAYKLLDMKVSEMIQMNMEIDPLRVLEAMLGAAMLAEKLNVYNLDMKLSNVLVVNSKVPPGQAQFRVIDWDMFVRPSNPNVVYDLPAGSMKYQAPEVLTTYVNIEVPSVKTGETEGEKEIRELYQKQKDFVKKYTGEGNHPTWEAEPAVVWTIGMSYFYLRLAANDVQEKRQFVELTKRGGFTGEVKDDMKELANIFMPTWVDRSATDPRWYWVQMVLDYLKTGGVSADDYLNGLEDWEKELLNNVLCSPEKRWTLQQVSDYLYAEDSEAEDSSEEDSEEEYSDGEDSDVTEGKRYRLDIVNWFSKFQTVNRQIQERKRQHKREELCIQN